MINVNVHVVSGRVFGFHLKRHEVEQIINNLFEFGQTQAHDLLTGEKFAVQPSDIVRIAEQHGGREVLLWTEEKIVALPKGVRLLGAQNVRRAA